MSALQVAFLIHGLRICGPQIHGYEYLWIMNLWLESLGGPSWWESWNIASSLQSSNILTWATDSRFNSCFLQHRDTVDRAFDVLGEHIPIQIKETKGKFIRYLQGRTQLVNQSCAGDQSMFVVHAFPPHFSHPSLQVATENMNPQKQHKQIPKFKHCCMWNRSQNFSIPNFSRAYSLMTSLITTL